MIFVALPRYTIAGTTPAQVESALIRLRKNRKVYDNQGFTKQLPTWMGQELEINMSDILNVTDGSFESEVLQSDSPVLVDYWAEWCGPCKMIAPILEEIAGEYAGKIKVAKLNIDENSDTPPKYGIRGIPTLMLFKNGNVEATKVGALSKSQLTAFLDSNI